MKKGHKMSAATKAKIRAKIKAHWATKRAEPTVEAATKAKPPTTRAPKLTNYVTPWRITVYDRTKQMTVAGNDPDTDDERENDAIFIRFKGPNGERCDPEQLTWSVK